ncbi:MAG: UDP-3-O-acyl-N-acetylglucosamine deacetylase [Endomicrobia bacterium]|nr:UDP-3-O-acyl-N-acetylglucosamine deacetylase [Endomicrobiia bacterium]
MKYLRTLKRCVDFEGIGIHTGEFSKIIISPSNTSDDVINFIINNKKISLSLKNIVDTKLCTTLGKDSLRISTVEHLLSVLFSLFITSVDIYIIKGREIPILDGSSKIFIEEICKAGLKKTTLKPKIINIKNTFVFKINNSIYKISPSNKFEIICSIKTEKSNYLNKQKYKFVFSPSNYIREIAAAKTFCFLQDIKEILSSGKGLGGNLENVIIINGDEVLNPEIMTYKNECVRHKILDFLGDISFMRVYFKGKFELINPNHYANFKFCEYLLKEEVVYGG